MEATSTAPMVPMYQIILDYIGVFIWPVVVASVLFSFRRVFDFLFLSLREFNFFGAKGKLKSPEEMIRKMADDRYEKERQEKEQQTNEAKMREELDNLSQQTSEKTEENRKLLSFAERMIEDKSRLQALTDSQRRQIDALLTQISLMQGNVPQPSSSVVSSIVANEEEAKDVGNVNPQTATSEGPKI